MRRNLRRECDDGVVNDTTRGRLLVATPDLADPNFARAVVLVLEHGSEGALGVILNRPSDLPVREALPAWSGVAAAPGCLFVGGPVQADGVIGLGRGVAEHVSDGFAPVFADLGTLDLETDPAALGADLEVRVFAGYAGWSSGQLEGELAAGGWLVVDRLPGDVFSSDPANLWRAVLRRQGGRLAIFALAPDDPSTN